jgi:hypothetical protein
MVGSRFFAGLPPKPKVIDLASDGVERGYSFMRGRKVLRKILSLTKVADRASARAGCAGACVRVDCFALGYTCRHFRFFFAQARKTPTGRLGTGSHSTVCCPVKDVLDCML